MRLAEGVPAGNQRDGFLVVHRHAGECLADIISSCDRIGLAVRSFGVDVDEAHLYRAERLLKLTFTAVAFVTKPRTFRSPVEFLWLPSVRAAAAKPERLEAHRLEGDIADQNKKIGPRDPATVFLFDGPQEPSRLIEVGIVWPAVERCKTLLTAASAAAPISNTIGARAVPGEADEQSAIMSKVSRPPVLRVRHQRV